MSLSEKIYKLTGLSQVFLNNIEDELVYIGPDYKIKWLNLSAEKQLGLVEHSFCFHTLCSRGKECKECILSGSKTGHCEKNFTLKTDKIVAHYSVGENYSEGVLLVFGDKSKFSSPIKADVQKIKENEILFHEANHDQLTALYNRRYMEYLFELIDNNKRNYDNQRLALTLIDIDEFKQINDTYGHSVGDEVLKVLAYRLNAVLRKTDTAIRIGGDEFLIIHSQNSEKDMLGFAKRLIKQVNHPILLEDGRVMKINISIGILMDAQSHSSLREAMIYADHALYEAKAKPGGRSHYVFFGKDLEEELNSEKKMAESLDEALTHGDFQAYYQPIVSLKSNRLCGAEALVRWVSEDGDKKCSTAQFLSVAESRNSIIEIGNVMVNHVFEDIGIYTKNMRRYDFISINFSKSQLMSKESIRLFEKLIKETEIDTDKFYIETNEESILNGSENIKKTIKSLRKLGVDIILDDFGGGTTSISSLLEYDIKKIKIDKEIVNRVTDSERHRKLLKTLVSIAKIHDIEVFAKGVETQEQLEAVKDLGCDYAQGYHICCPKPIRKFLKFAKDRYMQINQIKLILPEK